MDRLDGPADGHWLVNSQADDQTDCITSMCCIGDIILFSKFTLYACKHCTQHAVDMS